MAKRKVIILLSRNYSLWLLKHMWLIRKRKCILCMESEHTKRMQWKLSP